MIEFKEGIAANPLKISFLVAIGMHIILVFFNPIIILQLLTIILAIFIFDFALVTTILNLSPILLSFSSRVNNILPAITLLIFSSVTLSDNIPRPDFNTELVKILLIFTLLIIGCIYIGFTFINTDFPKLYRQINLLIGSVSIILSLITIASSMLGFIFLIIVICALVIMDKLKLVEFFQL